jgi:hypothetical protein
MVCRGEMLRELVKPEYRGAFRKKSGALGKELIFLRSLAMFSYPKLGPTVPRDEASPPPATARGPLYEHARVLLARGGAALELFLHGLGDVDRPPDRVLQLPECPGVRVDRGRSTVPLRRAGRRSPFPGLQTLSGTAGARPPWRSGCRRGGLPWTVDCPRADGPPWTVGGGRSTVVPRAFAFCNGKPPGNAPAPGDFPIGEALGLELLVLCPVDRRRHGYNPRYTSRRCPTRPMVTTCWASSTV